jgi:hypothetical protein
MRLRNNLPRFPIYSLKLATKFNRITELSGIVCNVKNKDVNYKVGEILEKNIRLVPFNSLYGHTGTSQAN